MPNAARAISGKFATIQMAAAGGTPSADFIIATKWSMDIGADIQTYNSIDSGGWTSTVAAAFSGNGTLEVTVSPDEMVGDTLQAGALRAVKLKIDSETGAFYMSGDARFGKFNYSADRAGGPQMITIPFQTDGPWAGVELLGDLTGGSGFTYS